MATPMETETIKMRSVVCQKYLLALVSHAESRPRSVIVDAREVENYQERFDQWAGNLGAFHVPESRLSLEYRLRNNPVIRDAIMQLLADLRDSTHSALDIVSGKQENRTALPLIDSEIDLTDFDVSSESESSNLSCSSNHAPSVSSASEIEELTSAIRGSIDNLFKTSVFIRRFAPKERRQRVSEKTERFTSQTDEMYIRDRYPAIERNGRADLIVRLGLANAHRRQYFVYCREHNNRLSSTDPANNRERFMNRALSQDSKKEVATTAGHRERSFLTTTEATDLVADNLSSAELPKLLQTKPTPSLVSFATTIEKVADHDSMFPPLPSDAHNHSFVLCAYCRKIVKLGSQDKDQHWRKHVLNDLEPYVCTYPGCSLDTYQSQHAWFEHELLVHRGTWPCFKCGQTMKSAETLENHIKTQHADQVSLQQLRMVVEQSRRPIRFIQARECPLCDDEWAVVEAKGEVADNGAPVVTLDDFRRHVGQHLQRIALFSLPRLGQNQEASSSAVIGGTLDRSLSSITSMSLGDQILEALVVSTFPPGSHQVYMPRGCLDPLITRQSIIGELTGATNSCFQDAIDTEVDESLITYILTLAQKVFAISIVCGVEEESLHEAIKIFRSAGFDDGNLPIQTTDSGEAPWSQLQWTTLTTQKFGKRQWMFLVPVFSEEIFHLVLEPHHILPFMLAPSEKQEGRFPNLWEITVHEAHKERHMRKLDGNLATAAVKAREIETEDDPERIWKDQELHARMKSLDHSHIVELQAIITWTGRGKYFMCQWPDGGNLRSVYTRHPRPILDADLVRETIQQLAGLAQGLCVLLDVGAFDNEGGFYRHASLKPENIWRFEDGSLVGNLRFCGVECEKDPLEHDHLLDRPVYDPPESILDSRPAGWASQSHGVWSIGCIILDLIIWLLYGVKELEGFIRGMNEALQSCSPYWVIKEDGTQRWAQVHPNVRAFMDRIAMDLNSGQSIAIGKLPDVVRTQLLVVPLPSDSGPSRQGRATLHNLRDALANILSEAKHDRGYWYMEIPGDRPSGPGNSIPPAPITAVVNTHEYPNPRGNRRPANISAWL